MRFIILLITFSFITIAQAQYSGYLGKRMSVYWGLATSPSIFNPTKSKKHPGTEKIGINTRNSLNVDWLLNKSSAVGITFASFSTKIESYEDYTYLRPYDNEVSNENDWMYDEWGYENDEVADDLNNAVELGYSSSNLFASLKTNIWGVNYTIFGNNMSPIGKYVKFAFHRINYKITNLEYYSSSTKLTNMDKYSQVFVDDKYHTYALTLEFGKQKVYFNRMTFRYGIEGGYVWGAAIDGTNTEDATSANVVFLSSNKRLLNHYMFNATIGVGCLIF